MSNSINQSFYQAAFAMRAIVSTKIDNGKNLKLDKEGIRRKRKFAQDKRIGSFQK
jgi:hypothetical protein